MAEKPAVDLRDKVAFVSGGGSGIGSCIAKTLMDAGARVFVFDVEKDHLSTFLADHPAARGQLGDVSVLEEVEAAFSCADEFFGRLDILVNNAGIAGPVATVDEIETADWERTLSVNLTGAFHCARQAIPRIRAQKGGSIINISSNSAFTGVPLRSPYAAAKWALVGLTKTWAMELGPEKIRVNALCPGSVEGARIERVVQEDASARGLSEDEIRSLYKRQNSMRVLIPPEQIAHMVGFLCSDAASMISGQAIGIDGHTESLGNWFD